MPDTRLLSLALCASLAFATPALAQPEAQAPETITLDDALAIALERSPRLRALRAELAVEEADVEGARVFPENPALELSGGARADGDVVGLDATVSLTQTLPLFGRWGAAVRVEEAEVDAIRARQAYDTQALLADVSRAFVVAQRVESLLALQRERAKLLEDMVALTERRVEAGDATQLDVNLWQAELGSARSRLERLRANAKVARTRLAARLGLDPTRPPRPAGALAPPDADSATRAQPLPDVAARADLAALDARVRAAEEAIALARARALPDVGVGVYVGTEKLTSGPAGPAGEYFGGARLVVPLPLFARNQGEVGRARAELSRAKSLRAAALLEAVADVEAKVLRFEAALAAMNAFESSVVATNQDTLSLLERAFAEGKIGMADLLTRQRTLLDARTEYLRAVAYARLAEIDLELATGRLAREALEQDQARSP